MTPLPGPSNVERRSVGYVLTVEYIYCRSCLPDGLDGHEPVHEGDPDDIGLRCDKCGEKLAPCDHQWEDDWRAAFGGGEIDFCKTCQEARYR